MKRLASLVAVVLTLTMVLSLAACGSDETTPDSTDTEDTTQSQTTEDTQGTEATEPAAGVDLAALRTQFATDYSTASPPTRWPAPPASTLPPGLPSPRRSS